MDAEPAHSGRHRQHSHGSIVAVQRLLVAPAVLCLKAPRRAAAVIAVVLLAIGAFGHSLRFDDNVARAFASQSPISRAYADFLDALGSSSQFIVVLAEAIREPDSAALAALRDLALEFELDDAAELVLSPFSVRFPRDGGPFAGETIVPADPQPDAIRQRLEAYEARGFPVNAMIAPDLRSAVLAVVMKDGDGKAGYAAQIARVRAVMAEIEVPAYTLTITGEAAISREIAASLSRDLIVLNSLGALLGVVAAWLIFRSPGAMVCVVAPAIAGTIAALGAFIVTGLPVTVISNVILILVLVLGLADGSHLTAQLLALDRQKPLRARIVATIDAVGPACALAALTTAIALAAIAFNDNEPMREFGIVGALAVPVAYCIVIATFVLCALVLDPHGKGRLAIPPFPRTVSVHVLRHARAVILAGLAVGAVAMAGFATTQPWFSVYDHIPENSKVRRAGIQAGQGFGGFFRFWAEFDTNGDMATDTPQGWSRLKAVTAAVAEAQPGSTVLSATTVAALAGTYDTMPGPEQLRDLPPVLTGAFLDPGADHVRLMAMVPDPMADTAALQRYDAMEKVVRDAGATRVAGLAALARHEPLALIGQLSVGLFAACLICSVVVAAYFRNAMLTWALILPNVLPLAITAAALHVIAGGHMSPTALLALTVAFGVAVDDSIHYITRYERGRAAGQDIDEALLEASGRTGQVMIITTVVISAGLLATFLSDFTMVRQFGLMLILTFASALVADLLLLPALLKVGDRR